MKQKEINSKKNFLCARAARAFTSFLQQKEVNKKCRRTPKSLKIKISF
jgi:hypothetical protein